MPIFHRSVKKLKTEENFVVVAPTGTGKSLGLPLKLLKDNLGHGKILVVQPRRIAEKVWLYLEVIFMVARWGMRLGI